MAAISEWHLIQFVIWPEFQLPHQGPNKLCPGVPSLIKSPPHVALCTSLVSVWVLKVCFRGHHTEPTNSLPLHHQAHGGLFICHFECSIHFSYIHPQSRYNSIYLSKCCPSVDGWPCWKKSMNNMEPNPGQKFSKIKISAYFQVG